RRREIRVHERHRFPIGKLDGLRLDLGPTQLTLLELLSAIGADEPDFELIVFAIRLLLRCHLSAPLLAASRPPATGGALCEAPTSRVGSRGGRGRCSVLTGGSATGRESNQRVHARGGHKNAAVWGEIAALVRE